MSTTSDAALIDRLRRTYDAVAESVDVGDAPVRIDGLAPPAPARRRAPGLVAAALLLVIAGIVGLVAIRSSDSATSSIDRLASQVRHATLSSVPDGYGLVSISTDIDRDTLVFANGSDTFIVTTQRSASAGLLPDTESRQRLIRNGLTAFVTTADVSTIRWQERPGIIVEIEATNLSADELADLAINVVMIGDEVWDRQVSSKGFASIDDAERAAYDAEVIGAESAGLVERHLQGSLQEGVNVAVGITSFDDLTSIDPHTYRWTDNGYIVWTDDDVATVRVAGPDVSIIVTPVADPGAPHMKVGSFELDVPDRSVFLVEYLDDVGNTLSTGPLL